MEQSFEIEVRRADRRLRHITLAVLCVACLAAIAIVIGLQRWISVRAVAMPTAALVVEMRRWIAAALDVSGACLLLLAALAARRARQARLEKRWPVAAARVLRDTRVQHGEPALRIARLLEMAAVVAMALALGAGVLGWRLLAAAH